MTKVNGKATTIKATFSRETSVAIDINAAPMIVWRLLTNVKDMARWNSTIVSLDGNIKVGETVQLVSTLDENRTFKLTVKELVPERRLAWGDRMGTRTYTITPKGDGVSFSMHEKIGGLMFPLFSRMIPDFDESFEQFSADLKQEAENAYDHDS